jgi:DNA-binding NarL/FixJ family response regulator
MTPREQQVVDMIDAGVPVQKIARLTRLSAAYVRQLGRAYNFDSLERQEQRQHAAIRAASIAHAAAVLATGKRYS